MINSIVLTFTIVSIAKVNPSSSWFDFCFLARCKDCGRVKYGQCERQKGCLIECDHCLRVFYSKECFDWHSKALCRIYHKCQNCKRIYYTYSEHICGEIYCRTCHVFHDPDRGCFIETIKEPIKKNPQIIMCFDFEVFVILITFTFHI